ncbi:amino acid ABC transporter permease [Mesorhizobium retamae]|uniref:ABC transporter permease subunit n=1 Tax=Mesorhizobium retamae TaxID=2912854 RepID=A0ABS9QM28_9HYPH|nr:ABC transporter permease subunit [Mesorhizobium sp. IRAMC:0171]
MVDLGVVLSVLLDGAKISVIIAVGALALAVALGFALASASFLLRSQALDAVITVYAEVLRNIPSLVWLLLVYFGLSHLGIRLPPVTAATVGLGVIGSAMLVDTFTASFRSVAASHNEPALALGLSRFLTFRLVIVPNSWRISLPPLGNYAVALVKDTTLAAAIAAPELMFQARTLVNRTFETGLIYGLAAAIYLGVAFILLRVTRWAEHVASH